MSLNVTLTFPATQLKGFDVEQLELREGISELWELTLQLLNTDPAVDMHQVVGQSIVVDMKDEPLLPKVEGIVRRARQLTSEPTGISKYELVVVPTLWLTTRRRDHRIFQDLTVPEIVAAVLAGFGQRIAPPAIQLAGNHPKREYTVQYGETDCDFIFRLLADEGISSFFDHANQGAWTLVDDTTLFTPSITGAVPFIAPSNLVPPKTPHVTAVAITSNVETSAVAIRDYDYEKPQFILQAKNELQLGKTGTTQKNADDLFANEDDLEAYEFEVGNFVRQPEGDARAAQLLGEARAARRTMACQSSFALAAGSRFNLVNHPRTDVGGELLVVRARTIWRTQASSAVATHTLECVDAARTYIPPRRPKPKVFGTHTAFVVGAAGEEIDVDSLGRVQVEFRWDRRDLHTGGTSRRVRVSQGWAGAAFGFVLLPRVNEEVIIAYLDGDPDEPIVVGRVHNAFVTTPLNLPAQKTRSIWRSRSSPGGEGFNEILMEDLAGAELLGLKAQRDFLSEAGRNSDTKIGVDQTIKVGGSQSVSISGGQFLGAGGDQTIQVGGQYTLKVGNGIITSEHAFTVSTAEALVLHCGGDRTDFVKGDYLLETNTACVSAHDVIQLIAPTIQLYGGSAIHLEVGGSSIQITDGGIKITSSGSVQINGAFITLN